MTHSFPDYGTTASDEEFTNPSVTCHCCKSVNSDICNSVMSIENFFNNSAAIDFIQDTIRGFYQNQATCSDQKVDDISSFSSSAILT